MYKNIDEHDNLGTAYAIAQSRFGRRAKSPFSTRSLGITSPMGMDTLEGISKIVV
jgi:hypothetical protein